DGVAARRGDGLAHARGGRAAVACDGEGPGCLAATPALVEERGPRDGAHAAAVFFRDDAGGPGVVVVGAERDDAERARGGDARAHAVGAEVARVVVREREHAD